MHALHDWHAVAKRRYVHAVPELDELLRRSQNGDTSAFASFVRVTQSEIWRFCRHLTHANDADDATQDTYVAAWQSLPAFRFEASARTWLFAIARNTALRTARRNARWHDLATKHASLREVDDPASAVVLRQLLSELDEDRRTAVVLTQLFGFSYEETSHICACPVGTVRSRVARGRRDLAALMSTRPDVSLRHQQHLS